MARVNPKILTSKFWCQELKRIETNFWVSGLLRVSQSRTRAQMHRVTLDGLVVGEPAIAPTYLMKSVSRRKNTYTSTIFIHQNHLSKPAQRPLACRGWRAQNLQSTLWPAAPLCLVCPLSAILLSWLLLSCLGLCFRAEVYLEPG